MIKDDHRPPYDILFPYEGVGQGYSLTGRLHWKGNLNITCILFEVFFERKNVRLTHNSTPDVRRGRGCVIKVDWGMLRELRV